MIALIIKKENLIFLRQKQAEVRSPLQQQHYSALSAKRDGRERTRCTGLQVQAHGFQTHNKVDEVKQEFKDLWPITKKDWLTDKKSFVSDNSCTMDTQGGQRPQKIGWGTLEKNRGRCN